MKELAVSKFKINGPAAEKQVRKTGKPVADMHPFQSLRPLERWLEHEWNSRASTQLLNSKLCKTTPAS